jgi:hypothetical protein
MNGADASAIERSPSVLLSAPGQRQHAIAIGGAACRGRPLNIGKS